MARPAPPAAARFEDGPHPCRGEAPARSEMGICRSCSGEESVREAAVTRVSPFDIFLWQPPGWPEAHPSVIVSHPDRASRKDPVEVVVCSTRRAGRKAEPHEMILDESDGLDWPTLCKCDVIYAVPRSDLKVKKGRVVPLRQGTLIRTIIGAHYWPGVL